MTHKDLIDTWPSMAEFAADIGASYGTVKAMRRRGSVPSKYWELIVAKARDRDIDGITFELLATSQHSSAIKRARRKPSNKGNAKK